MLFHIRLAALVVAAIARPAFAQDAQIPLHLEQRLRAAVDLRVAMPTSTSLDARDRAFQAAVAQQVSARLDAALMPPVRLGAMARRALVADASARSGRRVLYAAR